MLEPFLLRALLAGVGLAIVAAPLGCFVVWQRMAYFGETVAHASLIGVALGLAFHLNLTLSVLAVSVVVASLIVVFGLQKMIGLDSILGLLHHASLALGIIAIAMISSPSVDLMGFLFGDVFSVTNNDLIWIFGGAAFVLGVMCWFWQSLLRAAVHEDLAAAEGVTPWKVRAVFTVLLALTIAVAMKIVGILLVTAFLIVPAVAARPLSSTPERMVVVAALIAAASVCAGLWISNTYDAPGGPSIVLAMTLATAISFVVTGIRARMAA